MPLLRLQAQSAGAAVASTLVAFLVRVAWRAFVRVPAVITVLDLAFKMPGKMANLDLAVQMLDLFDLAICCPVPCSA